MAILAYITGGSMVGICTQVSGVSSLLSEKRQIEYSSAKWNL